LSLHFVIRRAFVFRFLGRATAALSSHAVMISKKAFTKMSPRTNKMTGLRRPENR
jgi:hypothetical protein